MGWKRLRENWLVSHPAVGMIDGVDASLAALRLMAVVTVSKPARARSAAM